MTMDAGREAVARVLYEQACRPYGHTPRWECVLPGPADVCREEADEIIAAYLAVATDDAAAERDRLRAVLEEIDKFGAANTGCGFSCARMAREALGNAP